MTKGMTWAATSVQKFWRRRLRFGFELRPPIAERLEWNPVRFAILSLIQRALLPRLMVLAPKNLAVTLTGSKFVGHLVSSLSKFVGENRSRPIREETSVQEMDAYLRHLPNFPVLAGNFPVLQNIFPVNLRREFRKKSLQHSGFVQRNWLLRPRIAKFPVNFPVSRQGIATGDRFVSDCIRHHPVCPNRGNHRRSKRGRFCGDSLRLFLS